MRANTKRLRRPKLIWIFLTECAAASPGNHWWFSFASVPIDLKCFLGSKHLETKHSRLNLGMSVGMTMGARFQAGLYQQLSRQHDALSVLQHYSCLLVSTHLKHVRTSLGIIIPHEHETYLKPPARQTIFVSCTVIHILLSAYCFTATFCSFSFSYKPKLAKLWINRSWYPHINSY